MATAVQRAEEIPTPALVPRVELDGARCESLTTAPASHAEERTVLVAMESPSARNQTIAVLRTGPRVFSAFLVMTGDAFHRAVVLPYRSAEACELACLDVLANDLRDRDRLLREHT